MDNTNVEVILRIMGHNFDTTEISKELGIIPTETWNEGEAVRNTRRQYTAWLFSTGAEETLDINDPLKRMEKIFCPKLDKLCMLKERYNLEFSIDIVIIIEKKSPPAIYLDPSSVHFAAAIDARFDMDTYVN